MNYFVICMFSLFFIIGNILDFVFINFEFFVEDVVVFLYVFELDYFFVIFIFRRKFNCFKNVKRMVYSYKKVDFEGLCEMFNYIFWEFVIFLSDLNDSVIKF